ncbi:general secretion pathway protein [mine drainage metagenome]|uniref:General secretion pathway protein n=1 Tax=mine drainage metagenome TaxID=410659 RepID=T1BZN1_9ZZZZ
MNRLLLTPFGLKWNPFNTELPTEALYLSPKINDFFWRIEQVHVREGGFALIQGDPGTGKSVALRALAERLERQTDLTVGILNHPQSNLGDFYRELAEVFGVTLKPCNRWGGFKILRERWISHLEATRTRCCLLIDEAQEMSPKTLLELRLLASARFDSQPLLAVVLAGDARLNEALTREELLPLGTRIRVRLTLDYATREELAACLDHLLDSAGAPTLMSPSLKHTLCERAGGNYRLLTNLAAQLLAVAAQRQLPVLDDKLYLEVFASPNSTTHSTRRNSRAR